MLKSMPMVRAAVRFTSATVTMSMTCCSPGTRRRLTIEVRRPLPTICADGVYRGLLSAPARGESHVDVIRRLGPGCVPAVGA